MGMLTRAIVVAALAVGVWMVSEQSRFAEVADLPDVARSISAAFRSGSPTVATISPPSMLNATTGRYNFGRYPRPVLDAALKSDLPWWTTLTTDKAFAWVSVRHGASLQLSMALLQFNYAAAAVFSVFDAETGRSWSLYRDLPAALAPLFGPKVAPDAEGRFGVTAGCITQRDWAGNASICFDSSRRVLVVEAHEPLSLDVNGPLTPRANVAAEDLPQQVQLHVRAEIDLDAGYFPTMVMPIGPNRPVYVSKYAARPIASGALTLLDPASGRRVIDVPDLQGALASSDWTRGQLRRVSIWKWISLAAVVDGRRYGLHLSSDTYDFQPNGASSESSVFTTSDEGQPSFQFYEEKATWTRSDASEGSPSTTKKKPTEVTWRIVGPDLDLEFTPHGGTFHGDIHLGVIDCDLWHMWGTFSGKAPLRRVLSTTDGDGNGSAGQGATSHVVLDRVPGVLEDHYSRW